MPEKYRHLSEFFMGCLPFVGCITDEQKNKIMERRGIRAMIPILQSLAASLVIGIIVGYTTIEVNAWRMTAMESKLEKFDRKIDKVNDSVINSMKRHWTRDDERNNNAMRDRIRAAEMNELRAVLQTIASRIPPYSGNLITGHGPSTSQGDTQ